MMQKKSSDTLFIIGLIVVILILLGVFFNLDRIFPEPSLSSIAKKYESTKVSSLGPKAGIDPALGTNPGASFVIVEFSDFQCPYCKRQVPVIQDILADYGDSVNYIFMHVPLTNLHPYSFQAAEAAECARDQGSFWEMHDLLFAHSDALDLSSLQSYAQTLGLDMDQFNSCLENHEKKAFVEASMREAFSQGITGTPSMMINGQLSSGLKTYDEIEALIVEAIA